MNIMMTWLPCHTPVHAQTCPKPCPLPPTPFTLPPYVTWVHTNNDGKVKMYTAVNLSRLHWIGICSFTSQRHTSILMLQNHQGYDTTSVLSFPIVLLCYSNNFEQGCLEIMAHCNMLCSLNVATYVTWCRDSDPLKRGPMHVSLQSLMWSKCVKLHIKLSAHSW